MPGPASRAGGHEGPPLRDHDHALHPAMAFDGAPEVIDPRRQGHDEFKALAGSQGNPLLQGSGLKAGIRHDLDAGLGKQGTLKPVCFPALIPHHQAHGLSGLHVNPSRREAKIVNDDPHFLILGGAGNQA